MDKLLEEIEKWSEKYNFSFQFWHKNNSVYISKDSFHGEVDLYSTGGYDTPLEVIVRALLWVYKVNETKKVKRLDLEELGYKTMKIPLNPCGKKHKK